jgi:hypothetical protein
LILINVPVVLIIVPKDPFGMTHPAVPEVPIEEAGGDGLDEYNVVPPDEVQ